MGGRSGPGQGRNTSGAVVGSVRDCLDLRRLEKHRNPFYRQGKGRWMESWGRTGESISP